jgi:hypothetical protein
MHTHWFFFVVHGNRIFKIENHKMFLREKLRFLVKIVVKIISYINSKLVAGRLRWSSG